MRALLVANSGDGHFGPLVPLGQALRAAGHDVAVVTPAESCPRVAKAGFEAFPGGVDSGPARQLFQRRFARPDPDVVERTAHYFVGIHAPVMVDDLVRLCQAWHPDVLVHEEGEYGTPVAASACGLPYACQSWGPMRPLTMIRRLGEAMLPLWERWGKDPGPLGGLLRYLYLDVCPPILQDPEIALVATARPVRRAAPEGGEPAPAWLRDMGPGPNVFVSLGTARMVERAGRVLSAVLEGVGELPLEVVVTVGRDNDPARYRAKLASTGAGRATVRIERFVSQEALLPHCDVVVHNGGANALLGAAAHGLPVLALPQGTASQERNARACVRSGMGLSLGPQELAPAEVGRCVRALVHDGRFRQQAARAERQIRGMPPAASAVSLLERLARDGRPFTASG